MTHTERHENNKQKSLVLSLRHETLHTHTHTHTYSHVCAHTQPCTHTHSYIQAWWCTHTPRYTYTYRYRYRYTQIHTLAVAMGRCPSDEGDTTRHAQKHNRLLCLKCVC